MKKRKEFIGRVVSNKMEKSVVVTIDRTVKDSRYEKFIRRTTKFKAHDEMNRCHVGDQVKLIETRPLSAGKRWVVLDVLVHAK